MIPCSNTFYRVSRPFSFSIRRSAFRADNEGIVASPFRALSLKNMAAPFSFAYLLVAAIYVSGTLGSPYYFDIDEYGDYTENDDIINHWFAIRPPQWRVFDHDILRHRINPNQLYRWLRVGDFNNEIYEPAAGRVSTEATSTASTKKQGSMTPWRKHLTTGIPPRRVGSTWIKEDDMGRHPQGVQHPTSRSRLDKVAIHFGVVTPDGDRNAVLPKNSPSQLLKTKAAQNEVDANDFDPKSTEREGEITETTHVEENSRRIGSNEEAGHPESGVVLNKNGTSEDEVKSETTDSSTAEETGTTEAVPESSRVEEKTAPSIPDKVEDSTVDDKISESSFPVTLGKETSVTVDSTVDHNSSKETLPSTTTFPSTTVTASETISSTPSTAGDSSSKEISPSKTPLPSSVVTASETVSSTLSTTDDRSSKIVSSSKTPLPSSTVTVTVSETVSPTPSTASDSSSKGGTSTPIPVTEHVIVLPRIRSARIVLTSVLLAIGLVAVAVAAVCIFRERRRKLKYDQLKLLP